MNEWIDVNKQKPKHLQYTKVKGTFPFEVNAIFKETPNGFEFIKSSKKDLNIHFVFYGVTHWMPLPEPPKCE